MPNLNFQTSSIFCVLLTFFLILPSYAAETNLYIDKLEDCDVTYTVTGTSVEVINLDAPINTVAIFDVNFVQVFGCNDFGGTPCMDTEVVNLPGPGTYFISVQTFMDFSTPVCDFFETIVVAEPGACDGIGDSDGDGICDDVDDCDNNLAGMSCDDNDPDTENDVYDSNCNCAGTPIGQPVDCPALSANIGDACDDGDASTCLLYTSPSPRDRTRSRMPSSA